MDELTTEPKPRSGCLPKTVGLLILASIVVGGIIYTGIEYAKTRFVTNRIAAVPASTPMITPVPTPADPPALVLARQLLTADELTRKTLAPQVATAAGSKIEAIDFLSVSLNQSTTSVRVDIIAALGLLARTNNEAFPALINALDDKSLRLEAMPALGDLGPTASAAIPKLKLIAQNKKEKKSVRRAAGQTINRIQGKSVTGKPASSGKRTRHRKKKK